MSVRYVVFLLVSRQRQTKTGYMLALFSGYALGVFHGAQPSPLGLFYRSQLAETLRHAILGSYDIGVIQDPVQPLHGLGLDRRPIPVTREFGPRVEQRLGDDLDGSHCSPPPSA